MRNKSDASYLVDLVGRIYDASLNIDLWPNVLHGICDALNAGGASIFVQDTQHGGAPIFHTYNIPDDGASEYLSHYLAIDPRVKYFSENPHLATVWDYQHITERQMDRDEYYDWLSRTSGYRYYAGGSAVSLAGYEGWIAPQRTRAQGHFSQGELEQFSSIVGHLRKSIDMMLLLGRQRAMNDSLLDSIDTMKNGIVLLDALGHIVVANRTVRMILGSRDGLIMADNALRGCRPADDVSIHTLIAGIQNMLAGARDSSMPPVRVSRPSGSYSYTLTACPLSRPHRCDDARRAAILVCIVDPELKKVTPRYVQELFLLTPAEARLAAALANGASLEEYSGCAGLKQATVRSVLKTVFHKTGTSRQSELVKKLLIGSGTAA